MDRETKKEFQNLAKMIKGGFDDMCERFNKNTKDHKKITNKVESLGAKINNLERRFDVFVTKNSKEHKEIKKDLAQIRRQLKKTVTETEIIELEQRVEALEQRVGLSA